MSDIARELIDQVNAARAAKRTLEILGGGSKRFMGRESRADETLNLGAHRGIVSYHPVELVLTARAGTPLTEIESALAEHEQMLAFEPPQFDGNATLGGTLACNQSGPARPWRGSVRDAVLGLRLINGHGQHLRFGGQVMKNVAGYDVARTQAGAFGTLGAITEISLKVLPKPAVNRTLVLEMPAQQAIEHMNRLAGQPKPLSAACWHRGRLYLRLSGAASAVEATARQWGGESLEDRSAFWASIREQQFGYFTGDAPLWRFSIKSSAPHWRDDGDWLIDWGGSQRWLRGDHEFAQLETEAANAGGQVGLYRHGNRSGEVFAKQPAAMQTLYRNLKTAFDPDRIFNPGRLYGWL